MSLHPPLSLSDEQLDTVQRAAAQIDIDLRPAFLQCVANLQAGEPAIGDGSVARACRAAQREFLKAPDLSGTRDHSRWR
jgi:hypothetical protein